MTIRNNHAINITESDAIKLSRYLDRYSNNNKFTRTKNGTTVNFNEKQSLIHIIKIGNIVNKCGLAYLSEKTQKIFNTSLENAQAKARENFSLFQKSITQVKKSDSAEAHPKGILQNPNSQPLIPAQSNQPRPPKAQPSDSTLFDSLKTRDIDSHSKTCSNSNQENMKWKRICEDHGLVFENQNNQPLKNRNYHRIFRNFIPNLMAKTAYERVFGDVEVPPIPDELVDLADSDTDLREYSLTLIPSTIRICVDKTFPYILKDSKLHETRIDYLSNGCTPWRPHASYRAYPEKGQETQFLDIPVSISNLEYLSAVFFPNEHREEFDYIPALTETVKNSYWSLQKISSPTLENARNSGNQLENSPKKQVAPLIDRYIYVILNFLISGKKIDDGKFTEVLTKNKSGKIERNVNSFLYWSESPTNSIQQFFQLKPSIPVLQFSQDSRNLLKTGFPNIDQDGNLVNNGKKDFSSERLASSIQILPRNKDSSKSSLQ